MSLEHKDDTRRIGGNKKAFILWPRMEFNSAIEGDKTGMDKLNKVSDAVEENGRCYRGFNFDREDEELSRSLGSGEFNISGFQNKDRRRLQEKTTGQVSRLVKRLRVHGFIKRSATPASITSPHWANRSSSLVSK